MFRNENEKYDEKYIRNLKYWRSEYEKYLLKPHKILFLAISPRVPNSNQWWLGATDREKVLYFYNPHMYNHLRSNIRCALKQASSKKSHILSKNMREILDKNPILPNDWDEFLKAFSEDGFHLMDSVDQPVEEWRAFTCLKNDEARKELCERIAKFEPRRVIIMWMGMPNATFDEIKKIVGERNIQKVSFPNFPGRVKKLSNAIQAALETL